MTEEQKQDRKAARHQELRDMIEADIKCDQAYAARKPDDSAVWHMKRKPFQA